MRRANDGKMEIRRIRESGWWAIKDLNLGPLPCEGSALTTELIARALQNHYLNNFA
jgi:hypothetical protein